MTVLEFLSIPAISTLISLFFKSQNDNKLEKIRSKLKLYELKQSKLHNDRADVIAKMYAMLKEMYGCIEEILIADRERQKILFENFWTIWNEYRNYYPKNIIFLPKKTANTVEEVSKELLNMFLYSNTINNSSIYGIEQTLQKVDNISQKLLSILEPLENEFRKLLGDE